MANSTREWTKNTDDGEVENERDQDRRFGRLIDSVKKVKDGITGIGGTFTNWDRRQR